MKISIAASRVLTSLSVVAALSSSAIAAADTVNKNTDFTTKFKENTTGNWEYKNTANDLTLSVDPTSVTTGEGVNIKPIELNKLTINANSFTGNVAVTLGGAENPLNPKDPLADTYSFNIDTKGDVKQNGATNVYHNSSIKSSERAVTFGNEVKVDGANLDITSKTGTAFNGALNALTISNKGNVNVTGDANLGSGAVTIESGKLNVTGKLTSTNNNFTFGSLDNSWNNNNQGIYAKGDVTLAGGTLNIQSSDLPLGQLNLITSGGKITNTGATLGSVSFAQDVSEYLSNQSLLAPYLDTGNYNFAIDANGAAYNNYILYKVELSTDKKTLYVDGQLTDAFKNAFNKNQDFTNLKGLATNLVNAESTNITAAQGVLGTAQTNVTATKTGLEGQKTTAEATIKTAEADKAKAEKELADATTNAAKKTAQDKIDAQNSIITTQQEALNQITSDLNVANAELKAIEAAIKDLDARNTEFNKLKTEITALADGATDAEKAKNSMSLKTLC
ncbi:hypothetical protein NCR95_06035 [Helicobacter sp. 11154-15]|uniref:Uncharacterized protein n=1 Tax=Helicobacter colisuis TaxID=2949739 RepID=A0ABT0TUX6_9HELI|nr:hypothetical protein [Helicobacter colisuis]MCL9819724.1 hypothetical protein [Helicobacter colisuis]